MSQDQALKEAIKQCLTSEYELHDGTRVKGCGESRLPAELRDKGWRRIPATGWFAGTVAELGFELVPAKSGKSTKGGYQYCQPVKIWVEKTAKAG
jgi:hypothetical protein